MAGTLVYTGMEAVPRPPPRPAPLLPGDGRENVRVVGGVEAICRGNTPAPAKAQVAFQCS